MKRHLLSAIVVGACVPLVSLLVSAQQPGTPGHDVPGPESMGDASRELSATRHSKLNQITTQNVGRLQVAWTMSLGTLRGQEGQPLVVGNMMYFESSYPNFVYAIDLNSYWRIVWKFAPEQDKLAPSVACCDLVNRGVAYADGKIFVTTLDAHLYALDAKTGKVLWRAKNGDPKLGQTMTVCSAGRQRQGHRRHLRRRVRRARLPHGVRSQHRQAGVARTQRRSGHGHPVRSGQDHRWRDAATGGPEFQPEDLEERRVEARRRHDVGMVLVRSAAQPALLRVAAIPERGIPTQRPGDNKWSMTIFARNPDTGVAAWAYQMTPHDAWDYDGINESVLTDSRGRRRDRSDAHAFRSQRLRLPARPPQRQAAPGEQIRSHA